MKDAKNRLFVKGALIVAIIFCLIVIASLYGPFLSWITWVPIHISDKDFAILAQTCARRAVIYTAITGGFLGLFVTLLVWLIVKGSGRNGPESKGSGLEK